MNQVRPFVVAKVEEARSTAFCFLCDEIFSINTDVAIIRFSSQHSDWKIAHRSCAESHPSNRTIDGDEKVDQKLGGPFLVVEAEGPYTYRTLPAGRYTGRYKYEIYHRTQGSGRGLYRFETREQTLGAVKLLNYQHRLDQSQTQIRGENNESS